MRRVLWCLPVVVCAVAEAQTVLFVDASASTGRNNGSSWANAFQGRLGVQAALAATTNMRGPIEIWVADGVYAPAPAAGDVNASFVLRDGVAIFGGFAGGETKADERNPELNVVTLTGDLNGNDGPNGSGKADNSRHVVFVEAVGPSAVLDGVVVERGVGGDFHLPEGWGGDMRLVDASPKVLNCLIQLGSAGRGAGVAVLGGAPTFEDCEFVGNTGADYGGGVYHDAGAAATFTRCRFEANFGGHGAGVFSRQSSPALTDCDFIENDGKIGVASGVGLFDDEGSPTLERCRFFDNVTGAGGGGVYLRRSGALLHACDFSGNQGQGDGGGAAFIDGGNAPPTMTPLFESCRFTGNNGAMMVNFNGFATLLNCTITNNIPGPQPFLSWPAIMCTGEGDLHLVNTIVFGNAPVFQPGLKGVITSFDGSTVTADHCCIQSFDGTLAGEGTFAANPLFVDFNGVDNIAGTPDDDLRLGDASPCIDVGDNAALSNDATDFEGLPRVADGDGDGKAIVDIGCHEHPSPAVFGDLNGDGAVSGADLGLLLAAWGSNDANPDLTRDGVVDGADLGALLAAWTKA